MLEREVRDYGELNQHCQGEGFIAVVPPDVRKAFGLPEPVNQNSGLRPLFIQGIALKVLKKNTEGQRPSAHQVAEPPSC